MSAAGTRKIGKSRAKRIFDLYDQDRSGAIDPEEVVAIMNALGVSLTLAMATKMINKVDSTGSGHLNFTDFCKLIGPSGEPTPPINPKSSNPSPNKRPTNSNVPFALRQAEARKTLRKDLMAERVDALNRLRKENTVAQRINDKKRRQSTLELKDLFGEDLLKVLHISRNGFRN